MLKNLAYLIVFILLVIIGFMWITIDKKTETPEPEKIEEPIVMSEEEIFEQVFESELGDNKNSE